MIQNYIHTGEHRISIIKDHRYDGGNIRPLSLPVVFYLIFKWIYSWVSSYPETIFLHIMYKRAIEICYQAFSDAGSTSSIRE